MLCKHCLKAGPRKQPRPATMSVLLSDWFLIIFKKRYIAIYISIHSQHWALKEDVLFNYFLTNRIEFLHEG